MLYDWQWQSAMNRFWNAFQQALSGIGYSMKFLGPDSIAQVSRRQLLQLGMGGVSAAAFAQVATNPDSAAVTAPEQWTALRGQLMLNPRWAYFDTASAGPATRAVLAAEYRALEAVHADEQEFYAARYNAQAVQQLCSRIASWINCSRDELTLTRGAQAALEQFANGFNFQPALQAGDELVLCNQLPAAALAFWTHWGRQRGLSIKTVMLNSPLLNEAQIMDSFAAALSERSRMVVFSHVQQTDGAILPVHELCRIAREHKTMSVVDGTLSLGAIVVSIADMECDVYATSFCHWLNGPQHTGALYVRRELQSQLPSLSDAIIEALDINASRMARSDRKMAAGFFAVRTAVSGIARSVVAARNGGKNNYRCTHSRAEQLCALAIAKRQSADSHSRAGSVVEQCACRQCRSSRRR